MSLTLNANAQNTIDILIKKINKFHKENRDDPGKKINDMYVNKTNKTIDIDDFVISLDSYKATYYVNHEKNETIHGVLFQCIENQDCIYKNGEKNNRDKIGFSLSGMGIAFKSKKACYEFINLIDELKKMLLSE